MTRLLRIDSSSRTQGSHSRDLADFFEQVWHQKYPTDEITTRDVTQPAIPHIDEITIAGFQTPPDRRTDAMKASVVLSDSLNSELKQADILLISTPMYNLSLIHI